MKGRTRQQRPSRTSQAVATNQQAVTATAVQPNPTPPPEITPPVVPGMPPQNAPMPGSNSMQDAHTGMIPKDHGGADNQPVKQSVKSMIGIQGTRTSYEDVVAQDATPVAQEDGMVYINVPINPASQVSTTDEQWQAYESSGWRKVDGHPRNCDTLVVMSMPVTQYNKFHQNSDAFYERTIGGQTDVVDAAPSENDDPGCAVVKQTANRESLSDLVDRMPKTAKDLTAERKAVMEAEGLSESDLMNPDDGDG